MNVKGLQSLKGQSARQFKLLSPKRNNRFWTAKVVGNCSLTSCYIPK